jgi:hypothetical protein
MIHLAGEALIQNMELNGAAGVTGSGTIERVRINAPGTTIEQSPGSVELAEGIKAEVAGKVLTGKREKDEPAPARPPSTPSPPTPPPSQPTPPPTPVKPVEEFIVRDGLAIGYKTVIVKLSYSDPQNYNVSIGDISLIYLSSQKYFYNDVPEGIAYESNVKVTKK